MSAERLGPGDDREAARQRPLEPPQKLVEPGQNTVLGHDRDVHLGKERVRPRLLRRGGENDRARIGERVERLRGRRAGDLGDHPIVNDEAVALQVRGEELHQRDRVRHRSPSTSSCGSASWRTRETHGPPPTPCRAPITPAETDDRGVQPWWRVGTRGPSTRGTTRAKLAIRSRREATCRSTRSRRSSSRSSCSGILTGHASVQAPQSEEACGKAGARSSPTSRGTSTAPIGPEYTGP